MTATKTAVVTGGASGIGLAISRRLAAEGMGVAILDLNGPAAEDEAGRLASGGAPAIGLAVDVTDRPSVDAAVSDVAARLGVPTVLVNSAGMPGFDRFLDISLDLWNRVIAVNLTGTFNCCQAVVPGMLDAGWGRIVNISSSSTHSGTARMTHYVAAKSGVVGLTKALALELAPQGITVNTIPPGFVDTPMLRDANTQGYLDIERTVGSTPVGRVGRPEDVAFACSFLVSEEAGYITGQIIGVNGGRNT